MIVDRHGRLLGKVNLLDACVLVILAALIPLGVVAFRVLNVETPKIVSIHPARSSSNDVITLTIRGENFYPPLQVRVGPLTLTPKTPADGRAISVELPAAELPPGEHDVLVMNPNGLTAKSAMKFARLVKPDIEVDAFVRFQMLRAEDRAFLTPGQVFQDRDGQEVARLQRLGRFRPAVERIRLGKEQFFERAVPEHFDVTLRLHLLASYRDGRLLFGDKPLEVNAPLTLQMPRHAISGKVLGFPPVQGGLAAEFLTVWSHLPAGLVAQIAVGDAQREERGTVVAEVLDIVGERPSGTKPWLPSGRGREVASGDVRRDLLVRMRLALDLGTPPVYRGTLLEEGVPFTFTTSKYEVEASMQALLTGRVKVLEVDVNFENLIPSLAEVIGAGDIGYSDKDPLRARVVRVISRQPSALPPGTMFPERAPERRDVRALLHVEAHAPVNSEGTYTFNGKELLINESFILKTSSYKAAGVVLGFRELPGLRRLP
ncbi:MAG: IPT/TIG domain-containing protein [Candidatus Tectomicrobia bacterium]|nr:IPT/TIG domain-containing protein [Candidatus Tectomicrobia bacterium]